MRICYPLLIGDLHLGEVVLVLADARLQRGAIAAARAILDVLADGRNAREAVRVTHAFHAVAKLAQLLEVRRRERDAQRVELLVTVLHENRNQVFEVLRDRDLVIIFSHGRDYSCPSCPSSQGLSDADEWSAQHAPRSALPRRRALN